MTIPTKQSNGQRSEQLTVEQSQRFFEVLDTPAKPTEALQYAMEHYQKNKSEQQIAFLQSRIDDLYEIVCRTWACSSISLIRSEALKAIDRHKRALAQKEQS